MDYLSIEAMAERWGISKRRLQTLCAEGAIEGAERFGRAWMIPAEAQKPADRRTKAGRQQEYGEKAQPMPKKTPFLYMSDLYHTAGTAEQAIAALGENHEAQVLFRAEIAYSRGEIDRVIQSAEYLLQRRSGFYAMISAGMLLALCAIWRGDLTLWRKAKVHIAEAPAHSDLDREIITFSITAVDSMLYDTSSFPDWFKIGCFEPLHRDSLPAAKVYYAKYLYAASYAVATREINVEGFSGLTMMGMVPYTLEPMIAQAMADDSVIAEIYLRMTCAAVYHVAGNDTRAIHHIDRALALALPDKLYGLLAEYYRTVGILYEPRLRAIDPAAADRVYALYKIYNAGWTELSNRILGRSIITTLSQREWEVAKLAAFGMSNTEIAEKMHMSLSGVKQAIRIVSEKTGASRDQFAAYL